MLHTFACNFFSPGSETDSTTWSVWSVRWPFAWSVRLIWMVWLVWLVWLVWSVRLNRPDRLVRSVCCRVRDNESG